jgi:uncharacterized protein YqhQ
LKVKLIYMFVGWQKLLKLRQRIAWRWILIPLINVIRSMKILTLL